MRWREEEEGGRLCGRIGSADGNICSPEGAFPAEASILNMLDACFPSAVSIRG